MAKAINDHSMPKSAVAMTIMVIPVAPPVSGTDFLPIKVEDIFALQHFSFRTKTCNITHVTTENDVPPPFPSI